MTVLIDPDCAAGKHTNCDGTGWDENTEALADCPCPCHPKPERQCLHCGVTKASIRSEGIVACCIIGGYEYREVEEEWANHRWADWTDTDLSANGISPGAFDKHRRTQITQLTWVGCEDTARGHIRATVFDPELGCKVGQCMACGNLADELSGGGSDHG